MCKSRIFAELLSLVSVETEVPEEMIMSRSRAVEVVDARCILVKLLSEEGIYPSVIAGLMGRTPAGIRHILSDFDSRLQDNRYLENNAQAVRKQLKNKS